MRPFFYLPFMHSEALIDQDRSVRLCEALGEPEHKEGDMQAIKELANRLDGRPAQILEHNGPDSHPIAKIVSWPLFAVVRARARVMGFYSEPDTTTLCEEFRERQPVICRCEPDRSRDRCATVGAGPRRSGHDQPSFWVPPWNRQRRFPGTTLMMHGAPARVLAQHLGRNLRFNGSPLCDRPRSNIPRHQRRSRQVTSEQRVRFWGSGQ